MAAYFEFEKKRPHINIDDVYVISGDVKDDQLILNYSIQALNPLSICLSSFDKFTYLSSIELCGTQLIAKYSRSDLSDLSIELSAFDTHINMLSVEDNVLKARYNNIDDVLSADLHKYDTHISNCYVDGNNLILQYNDSTLPLIADLDKFNTHVSHGTIIGNDLLLHYNDETPTLSIALDRFHVHVDSAEIDDCDQLILKYVDDVKPALSVDLSKYTRNYYISKMNYQDKILELVYNTPDAGLNLSAELSILNTYVDDVVLEDDDNLKFTYNAEHDDIDVNVSRLNNELTSIIRNENILCLHFANGKTFPIDMDELKLTDTYISTIVLDDNDVLVFDYNTATPRARQIDLHKFARNDYIRSATYSHDTSTIELKYNELSGFETVLSPLSIDVSPINNSIDGLSTAVDLSVDNLENMLSDMYFRASDEKSILSIAQAVEQIVTRFGGNR